MMQHKVNAILVDDEPGSLFTLRTLLEKYCPDVNVLAATENPLEAIKLIKELQPNLLFLDIEMPYANAFDMLDQLHPLDFEVVFVTAFNNYALKAFKYLALDYLLKPLNINDLVKSVDRVKQVLNGTRNENRRVKGLLTNLKNPGLEPTTITVNVTNGFEVIEIGKIVYIQALGGYSIIHLKDEKKIMSTKGLSDFEEVLPGDNFARVHHSYIVNTLYVKRYHRARGGKIEMLNGAFINISVRKKADFLEKFKG